MIIELNDKEVEVFIEKCNRDYSEAYEDIAISGTHYILAEDDGPDALQEIQEGYEAYETQ